VSKCLALLVAFLAAVAQGGDHAVDLSGDFISMALVERGAGQKPRLAVFDTDRARPRRTRHLNWLEKLPEVAGQPRYKSVARERVPAEAAGFDVCRLDPASPAQTLVYLYAGGVRSFGGDGLVGSDTLLAHVRDDALPRIRLCFDLFKGEPPALLVPRIDSVEIWRARTPGRYVRDTALPVEAGLRFWGQPLRGNEPWPVQRLSLRLEMPDVVAADYDGDGRTDLCLCREDRLSCHTQGAGGFAQKPTHAQFFGLLSDEEEKDNSLRVECRLVELTGDARIDLVLQKSQFNVSDMRTALHLYPQQAKGGFPAKPAQVLERSGYFAFHEYFDIDGDRRTDIVAPVASLSWTDIASIYLSRKAEVEFVYYRNTGGGAFAPKPVSLHTVSFPIDLKNWNAILGVLPVWSARFKKLAADKRQLLFFPDKSAVELYTLEGGVLSREPIWRHEAELGSDIQRVDLDADGFHELVFAYPKDAKRARRLLFVEAQSP
jgi:hypothetical protein